MFKSFRFFLFNPSTAELGAICTGAVKGQCVRSLLAEQGMAVQKLMICSDSQAAIDGLIRGGVGRLKHIAIRALFLTTGTHQKQGGDPAESAWRRESSRRTNEVCGGARLDDFDG